MKIKHLALAVILGSTILAEAADAFGRGHEVARFKPSGALEVRRAAHAFLAMKARISRHIDQRTTLLAAVSHDLRTPLTRLKLALAMMTSAPEIDALKQGMEVKAVEFVKRGAQIYQKQ